MAAAIEFHRSVSLASSRVPRLVNREFFAFRLSHARKHRLLGSVIRLNSSTVGT